MKNQEKTYKHENRDLYETPCLWVEIEVFTNRAQEKLNETRNTRVRKGDFLEVLDRLWATRKDRTSQVF